LSGRAGAERKSRARARTNRNCALGDFAALARATDCDLTKAEYDDRATERRARPGRLEQGEEPEMNRLSLVAAGLALAASGVPAHAQQADGRVLALSCLNCHGPGGKSQGEIPSIAGKSEEFLKNALVEFRDGKRSGTAATVMPRLAKGYSDAEIDALVKYVATLK
jgi:cytochrome c553